MTTVQEEYNRLAYKYDSKRSAFMEKITNAVIWQFTYFPKDFSPKRVLDIGCGTWTLLYKVQKLYPDTELIGIDISRWMLDVARKKLPDATFLEGDFATIDLPHASYDLIVSSAAFHFMGNYEHIFEKVSWLMSPSAQYSFCDYCREWLFIPIDLYLTTFFSGKPAMCSRWVYKLGKQYGLTVDWLRKFWYKHFHMMTWFGWLNK